MASVKTDITELPESRVRVRAEVPAEEVERRVQQAARDLGRQLRIPGFRKGKVPPPVVIRRLGREAVLDEAVRSSLNRWYVDAIGEAGISPVGDPDLDLDDLPREGQPLSFSIEIGVRPKARLGQYKGVEVGRREPHVEATAIDEQIEQLRDRLATLETVDRAAQTGDFALVDFTGTVDGEPLEGAEGRDQLIELGTGNLRAEMEQALIGAAAGDTRRAEITLEDDRPPELAGKTAVYELEVSEVRHKRLPELDDDFASDAAGLDTLAELREDIAKRLGEADERAIEREFEAAVLDAVAAEATLEIPERLVHAKAHELVEDTFEAFARRGVSKENYLRIIGQDEESLAHEAEAEAEKILRRDAVLAAVVEAEGIEPSEEELLEAVEPTAEREGAKATKLLERLRSNGRLDAFRGQLAAQKALEFLVSQAHAISVEQAKAREKLWTPGKGEEGGSGSGQLWTPESGSPRPAA
jgi:trigger factor